MTKRILQAALAVALIATVPLDAAFARGGGGAGGGGGFGGGGGGGGDHSGGGGGGARSENDRGSLGYSRPQNASDQKLFDTARKDCSGARYPSGATPRIDYASQTYSCFETGSSRR